MRERSVSAVPLQVAHELAATTVHPTPVREGFEDRVPARRPAGVRVELFKVAADLSLEQELLAMADREGILVIVIQLEVTREAAQGCIPHVDLARAAVLLGLALVVEGLSKSPRLYLHVHVTLIYSHTFVLALRFEDLKNAV